MNGAAYRFTKPVHEFPQISYNYVLFGELKAYIFSKFDIFYMIWGVIFLLKSLYEEDESSFLAVYGRRLTTIYLWNYTDIT